MCALSLEKKSEIIKSYQAALSDAKMVILSGYSGSTVQQFEDMRKKLSGEDARVFVIKNTLFKRAAKGTHFEKLAENLQGPTAAVISMGDSVGPAKVMDESFSEETLRFVFKSAMGVDSSEFLSASEIQVLARLPSKEVLMGRLVGSLVAPLRNVMGVFQAVPRNLVYALSQVSAKKSE